MRVKLQAFSVLLLSIVASYAGGCAYPHRSTSISTVGQIAGSEATPPPDLWQLTIVSATLPAQKHGALPWDGDGTGPDPFVRIYRGDTLVFETEAVSNAMDPIWKITLPKNVWFPRDKELRFEVWDQDDVTADPMGRFRSTGLPPTALTDADARVTLDNDAVLVFRITRPVPNRGIGIANYEAQNSELVVLEVLRHSPAARAGIVAGDSILAIGGRSVDELGPQGAASALSMAAADKKTLKVLSEDGKTRDVSLDDGYIWLTM